MAEFLLLNEDSRFLKSKPGYMGTCRAPPEVLHSQTIDCEFNDLLSWYLEQETEGNAVQDVEKAKRLIQLYRVRTPPLRFQLIEITRDGSAPSVGGKLLGFDLTYTMFHSLLSWGLGFSKRNEKNSLDKSIQVLLQLIEAHFKPKLNSNVLFDDFETASFCLGCMMALQTFKPGLWESGQCRFEVFGLYLVEVE